MDLTRLRELAQAGKDGALRPEEAKELFDALPEVFARMSDADAALRSIVGMDNMHAVRSWVDAYFLRHS